MTKKPPPTFDLMASADWVEWKFGVRGEAKGALKHVNRCLDEIASKEYDFLMTKADLLGYLEKWEDLNSLLAYLEERYPNDPEVLSQREDFLAAHGQWEEALTLIRRIERMVQQKHVWLLETLYYVKVDCLVALARIPEAKREIKRISKKYPRLSSMRQLLWALENGSYKTPEAFALI